MTRISHSARQGTQAAPDGTPEHSKTDASLRNDADAAAERLEHVAFDPVHHRWVPLPEGPAPVDHAIALRPWRMQDAPRLQAILGQEVVWRYLPESAPETLDEGAARDLINLSNSLPHHVVRAIWQDGEIRGQVRLEFASAERRRIGEISYWIDPAHWGQGLAGQVIPDFCAQMFAAEPGLLQIEARVHPQNVASARALERAGFAYQEKREDGGGWRIYARRRS